MSLRSRTHFFTQRLFSSPSQLEEGKSEKTNQDDAEENKPEALLLTPKVKEKKKEKDKAKESKGDDPELDLENLRNRRRRLSFPYPFAQSSQVSSPRRSRTASSPREDHRPSTPRLYSSAPCTTTTTTPTRTRASTTTATKPPATTKPDPESPNGSSTVVVTDPRYPTLASSQLADRSHRARWTSVRFASYEERKRPNASPLFPDPSGIASVNCCNNMATLKLRVIVPPQTKHIDFEVQDNLTVHEAIAIFHWKNPGLSYTVSAKELSFFRMSGKDIDRHIEMLDSDSKLFTFHFTHHETLILKPKPKTIYVTCTKAFVVDFDTSLDNILQQVLPSFGEPYGTELLQRYTIHSSETSEEPLDLKTTLNQNQVKKNDKLVLKQVQTSLPADLLGLTQEAIVDKNRLRKLADGIPFRRKTVGTEDDAAIDANENASSADGAAAGGGADGKFMLKRRSTATGSPLPARLKNTVMTKSVPEDADLGLRRWKSRRKKFKEELEGKDDEAMANESKDPLAMTRVFGVALDRLMKRQEKQATSQAGEAKTATATVETSTEVPKESTSSEEPAAPVQSDANETAAVVETSVAGAESTEQKEQPPATEGGDVPTPTLAPTPTPDATPALTGDNQPEEPAEATQADAVQPTPAPESEPSQPSTPATVPDPKIPVIVHQMLDCLERDEALNAEGIFRLSGKFDEVRRLKTEMDLGQPVNFADFEPHVTASLLKKFLHELPEPLLSSALYTRYLTAASEPDAIRMDYVRALVAFLPKHECNLLRRLLHSLRKVVAHSSNNRMDLHNLATAFSPVLLRESETALLTSSLASPAPHKGPLEEVAKAVLGVKVIELLIGTSDELLFPEDQAPLTFAKVIQEYKATQPGEINLQVDDLIFVFKKTDTEWWCEVHGTKQVGTLPVAVACDQLIVQPVTADEAFDAMVEELTPTNSGEYLETSMEEDEAEKKAREKKEKKERKEKERKERKEKEKEEREKEKKDKKEERERREKEKQDKKKKEKEEKESKKKDVNLREPSGESLPGFLAESEVRLLGATDRLTRKARRVSLSFGRKNLFSQIDPTWKTKSDRSRDPAAKGGGDGQLSGGEGDSDSDAAKFGEPPLAPERTALADLQLNELLKTEDAADMQSSLSAEEVALASLRRTRSLSDVRKQMEESSESGDGSGLPSIKSYLDGAASSVVVVGRRQSPRKDAPEGSVSPDVVVTNTAAAGENEERKDDKNPKATDAVTSGEKKDDEAGTLGSKPAGNVDASQLKTSGTHNPVNKRLSITFDKAEVLEPKDKPRTMSREGLTLPVDRLGSGSVSSVDVRAGSSLSNETLKLRSARSERRISRDNIVAKDIEAEKEKVEREKNAKAAKKNVKAGKSKDSKKEKKEQKKKEKEEKEREKEKEKEKEDKKKGGGMRSRIFGRKEEK